MGGFALGSQRLSTPQTCACRHPSPGQQIHKKGNKNVTLRAVRSDIKPPSLSAPRYCTVLQGTLQSHLGT